MKIILKYKLIITDFQTIQLPAESEILSVLVQGDDVVVYALVPEFEGRKQNYTFALAGAGKPITNEALNEIKYLDTVQHGPFVWHIFYSKGDVI